MCARDAGAVRTRIMPGVVPTTALPEEQGARSAACVAFPQAVGGNISVAVAQAVGGNFSALSGFAAQEMCRLCAGHDVCTRATQELCVHASCPK